MGNVWTIMSKEFTRFFTDKRMVVMTILPAGLIYLIYSFMGSAMMSVFAPDEGHEASIYTINAPPSVEALAADFELSFTHISAAEAEEIRAGLKDKDESVDLLAVFPADFDALVEAYDERTASASNGGAAAMSTAPNVELYYNSTVPNSSQAYRDMYMLLDYYESSLANKFDINRSIDNADLATIEEQSATVIASMMPLLLMIFLYSGSMGLALESITGEKERGTLATLLVSPLRRSQLAVGKILSLATLSFISGAVTTVATIAALPNLMGGAGGDSGISANIYSGVDYALLAFVILSTLLLMITILSIVSAFAKTVKEAGQAATPLMILVMVVGVSGMFSGASSDTAAYLVPLYGSVQSMCGIFALEYDAVNVIVACLSTLAYAALGGFVLTKMFNSEKVMFSR